MCGIFGFIPHSPLSATKIKNLATSLGTALAHRGPDDSGWTVFSPDKHTFDAQGNPTSNEGHKSSASLLLGQTRLSIIDLSPGGHQPMFSTDGRYCIVYNGEIYNYLELRRELESLGVTFKSHTDTEVLLYALIYWGKACLTRLVGMFAFALYDSQERTLFCARDFFGIKPFYYHSQASGFAFASELPALLQIPGVSKKLAPQQVYNYLCFSKYDKGNETFFKDIYQLPPAHCLTLHIDQPGSLILEKYWSPDLSKRSNLTFHEATAKLRELFLDSVKLHLRSDVPLGVALSGGIDSSSVVCAVRHLQPDTKLHTFSFIAKGSNKSEEHWANLVAEHTKAVRHMVVVEPEELTRDLDNMILHLGEPFGSTSIYAQYRVFKLAQDSGIKVTLDGQGADELLAGYHGYPAQRMASLLSQGNIISALNFFYANKHWPGRPLKKIFQQTVREFLPKWLIPLGLKIIGTSPTPAWLDVEKLTQRGVVFTTIDERDNFFPKQDRVRQTLAYQLTWEGLPQLLRHGDRNAMAFSIESRVPFLTKEIAEFCLSLPEDYLIDRKGRTKSVFREAMRGIVPDEILDRRDKIGFETPEQEWLDALSPWVEETLSSAKEIPYMNLAEARKEWQAIKAGKKCYNLRVWRWLNYVRWVSLLGVEE